MPDITYRSQALQQLVAANLVNTASIVSAIENLASGARTLQVQEEIALELKRIREGAVLTDLIVDVTRTASPSD